MHAARLAFGVGHPVSHALIRVRNFRFLHTRATEQTKLAWFASSTLLQQELFHSRSEASGAILTRKLYLRIPENAVLS